MPQIAEIDAHVQGDIGGLGISRFRFVRQDAAAITPADCQTAANAARAMLFAYVAQIPTVVNWTFQGQVNIYESTDGVVQGPITLASVPSAVVGTSASQFSAGTGVRFNWKTNTLSGRRLIRGATFLVPCASNTYGPSGAVSSAAVTVFTNAAVTYLNALNTAQLNGAIWHRPLKGAVSGGVVGFITGMAVSSAPSSLRSRRH